jgi:hypothetical protein
MQQLGQPQLPAVFGPSGVLNPLVPLLAAGSLVVHGGALGMVAALVAAAALAALLRDGGKNIRMVTVVVALALMLLLNAVMSIASGADSSSPPPPIPAFVTPPADVAPPAAEVVPPQARVRTVDDFMVPELVSVPVSRAPAALPEEPGAVPTYGDPNAYDAPDVDRLPRLENEQEAARALATVFAQSGVQRSRPDTAVLWVLVGEDGRVKGSQVVFSTSRRVAQASVQTLPYLRYVPGMKKPQVVSVWISQRMIVVP